MDRRVLGCLLVAWACTTACTVTKRNSTSSTADAGTPTAAPDEFPRTSSALPTAAEWQSAIAITLADWDAPCTTSRVREWLRVACPEKDRPMEGVQLVRSRGFGSEVTTEDTPQLAAAIVPVRPGGDILLTFLLPDGARDLRVLWSLGSTTKPSITFAKDTIGHEKLRCTAPSKSGPCCYRAFSGTSFHPELQCDRTRYQEICVSDADCDSRTHRTCRKDPAGTTIRLCGD